jgi:hypothetical protein
MQILWPRIRICRIWIRQIRIRHKKFRMRIRPNDADPCGSGSTTLLLGSVAEPHDFHAAAAPGENFDAVPAPAPNLPVLYSKPNFF